MHDHPINPNPHLHISNQKFRTSEKPQIHRLINLQMQDHSINPNFICTSVIGNPHIRIDTSIIGNQHINTADYQHFHPHIRNHPTAGR